MKMVWGVEDSAPRMEKDISSVDAQVWKSIYISNILNQNMGRAQLAYDKQILDALLGAIDIILTEETAEDLVCILNETIPTGSIMREYGRGTRYQERELGCDSFRVNGWDSLMSEWSAARQVFTVSKLVYPQIQFDGGRNYTVGSIFRTAIVPNIGSGVYICWKLETSVFESAYIAD